MQFTQAESVLGIESSQSDRELQFATAFNRAEYERWLTTLKDRQGSQRTPDRETAVRTE